MSRLIRQILNLEQYQCRSCKRFFYINVMDRSSLDLDFGCPYGCDDSGMYIRDIRAEVKKTVKAGKEKSDGK